MKPEEIPSSTRSHQPIPEHGKVFIEEIASDALQILPHTLSGYIKTSDLLIRGIIENTLRHIYFSDHPVEFLKMNGDQRWYIEVKDLFIYCREHPKFIEVEKQFDAIAKLKSQYSELSTNIHGGRVKDLEMRIALEKIVFDQKAFEQRVALVKKCVEAANFLIAVFHADKVHLFQSEDKSIILRSMSVKARKAWKDCE